MKSIFTYSDFREYLKDALEEKRDKNPAFSYRCAATRIGISSGSLTRILNGSRHAGDELVPKLITFLGLKRHEAEYFILLTQFDAGKDESRRRICYQEILRIRSERNHPIPEENHQFFEQWYHVALFELLRTIPQPVDSAGLGAMLRPPVSESKTRKALELLKRLGYVKQHDQSGTCSTEPFLTTGDDWESVAIHAFQIAMSQLAVEALDTIPKEDRDISTLTLALSGEVFAKVRDIVRNARAEITALEQSCTNPERVYQINFQCFPLSVKATDRNTPPDRHDRNENNHEE